MNRATCLLMNPIIYIRENVIFSPKKYLWGVVGGGALPQGGMAPKVTINMTNTTGVPMEAQQEFESVSFEETIAHIVLKTLESPAGKHYVRR